MFFFFFFRISIALCTRFLLLFLFGDFKGVKVNSEDIKWNQTSKIDVKIVKNNLTKLYSKRQKIIQDICLRERKNNNTLLMESNKLHG